MTWDPTVPGRAVSGAIIELEQTANALLAEGAFAEADETCNAVFEIDATIAVPSAGYSLNAARRFLIAFGRRKHIAVVPWALMFGRARQHPEPIWNSEMPAWWAAVRDGGAKLGKQQLNKASPNGPLYDPHSILSSTCKYLKFPASIVRTGSVIGKPV